MREILFRGKRTDNGEWVESDYIFRLERHPITHSAGVLLLVKDEGWVWVIPETVGQYTGLSDINGKKIFDGDIVDHFIPSDKRKVIGNIYDNPELLKGDGNAGKSV